MKSTEWVWMAGLVLAIVVGGARSSVAATNNAVLHDYDGDGQSDLAVYDRSTGRWFIQTTDGQPLVWGLNWGFSHAIAVPGDFDGDGKADLAVYDTHQYLWYVTSLSKGVITWGNQWGASGLQPVSCDFDGDGKSDLCMYDTGSGNWYIKAIDGRVLAWQRNWGYAGAAPPGAVETGTAAMDMTQPRTPLEILGDYAGAWVGRLDVEVDGTNCVLSVYVNTMVSGRHVTLLDLNVKATGERLWQRPGNEGFELLSDHSFRGELDVFPPEDDEFIVTFTSLATGTFHYSHLFEGGVTFPIYLSNL